MGVTAISLALAQISCTGRCDVADTVSIIDQRDSAYLVYRISGAQDKMEFFEIYRAKPDFDSCGSTRTPAIAKEPFQASEGLLKKVIWRGNRLEIVYTQKTSESIRPEQARLNIE
jgi:hypothetical protein